MTKTNEPRLRFKQFDGEWKKEKIREISDTFSGGTPNVNDKDNYGGNIPFIRSSDINKNDLELYLTDEGIQSSSAKLVKKGTLLVALYGATSGKTGISKVDGAINQAILAILPKEGFNKLYIYSLLNYKKNEIINKYIQGGQGNLSGKIINDLNYFYPDSNEQQVIGSFFVKIDKLIELQNQKLEQLKKLKRGYLQKMFPQDGESLPRLRFSGFSGEWEEEKMGSIANIYRGASPRPIKDKKWFDDNSKVGWIRISDVTSQNGRITKLSQHLSKEGQKKTRVLKESHLLLSIAASVGKPVINYVETGVHDGFLIFDEPQFNIDYMFYFLEYYQNRWNKFGQPGSQVNLNSEIVKSLSLFLPDLDEQKKIALFIKSIDQMVENQTNKIDVLKQQKKAYLQKMFI